MDPITVSCIVAVSIVAAAFIGLRLHQVLPDAHLSKETLDVIRLGTGMLSVLASLVLGLLIATAKSSYDATDHAIRTYAASLILLHETLRDYGDDAAAQRTMLRSYTETLLAYKWPEHGERRAQAEDRAAGQLLEHVRETIRALRPVDEGQKWLLEQALQISSSLLQQRWLLIEQEGPSVKPMIVVILVTWIALIFLSFGINAPRNATVVGAFLVCSVAIGGAVFLVLELDRPFDGVLRISAQPLRIALTHMAP